MWGAWVVFVALCLAGVSGKDTRVRLHWCNTLCMCRYSTEVEVKCFERSDIYDLLDINKIQVIKLERANWHLENQVLWCNDTCLCHQNTNAKVFKCVEKDVLHQFISDEIGDMYYYQAEEEEAATRKRSDERRKHRGNRKHGKRRKKKQQVTEKPSTTTTLIPEVIEEVTTPETEVDFFVTEEIFQTTLLPTTEMTMISKMPSTSKATSIFLPTEETPVEAEPEPEPEIEFEEEVGGGRGGGGSFEDDDAEILPKQEAVAASPAVTAMQPPTRRQPFPPTVSSHAATREAETPAPKVSAVLEVPIQRKTVASEVSQDLDELGSAVMQIKSDVVLNQRILLVTVAVAGIAMLGVLLLAVHSCFVSRRQAAAEAERRKKETPKDDNHVTKVNLEEAW